MLAFTGKKFLITGGSSGIGLEAARVLAEYGASVCLVSRSREKLESAVASLKGSGHVFYPCDLETIGEINPLLEKVVAEFGKLDGFVHSAGQSTTIGLRALKIEKLAQQMAINFYSFVEILKIVSKPDRFNPPMAVVAVSSIASLQGNRGKAIYCATKAALDASIRCFAKELADKNIRVNSVAPGLVETEILEDLICRGGSSSNLKSVIDRQYLGIAKPRQIATVIAFLLSDLSSFMTGLTVPVDGGRLTC